MPTDTRSKTRVSTHLLTIMSKARVDTHLMAIINRDKVDIHLLTSGSKTREAHTY